MAASEPLGTAGGAVSSLALQRRLWRCPPWSAKVVPGAWDNKHSVHAVERQLSVSCTRCVGGGDSFFNKDLGLSSFLHKGGG